jgi:hypothetical protein
MVPGETRYSRAPVCHLPTVVTYSRGDSVGPGFHLYQPSSGMAGRRQRQALNKVFSAQRLHTAMPIFWDVTRRVCV